LLLGELTASARRLALVGLAKNTGKTVALAALLSESAARGRRIGVTSIGRDGEEHDVIDARIEKPPVRMQAGGLVATTDALLRASGLPHEPLARTGVRTPLGEVLVARLLGPGTIEVAGPSASEDVRAVAETMLAAGAEQVLIDGAIDRRAASSPQVSDGLVMCTGAVLDNDLGEIVRRTADAVALVRLPRSPQSAADAYLARPGAKPCLLVDGAGAELGTRPPRFALTAQPAEIAAMLAEHPDAERVLLAGALPEAFVAELALAARRGRRSLAVAVTDPTHAFLSDHGPDHYERMGLRIETMQPIDLRALTVNPVAPQSHRFDSDLMRSALAEAIEGAPVIDVMAAEYLERQALAGAPRG
jgi:hypothetical protein